MKFNLNDYIKVQLTDTGRAIHRADHVKAFTGFDDDPHGFKRLEHSWYESMRHSFRR